MKEDQAHSDWCYRCHNIIGGDLNKCNGCKANANENIPPSKFISGNYSDFLKKEKKSMIVTIIGSLTKKKEMDEIKAFWERSGAVVNSPGDPEVQKEPLVAIQRTWIEKIEEADLIVAVPKGVAMTANGDSKYVLEFGESTSYEMAIAKRFNKVILFG